MKHLIPVGLLLMAFPSLSHADEPYVGYERERTQANVYQRIAGRDWWSDCGRRITERDCRRIRAKDAQRSRYARDRREERIYAAEPRRRDRDEDIGPRKQCGDVTPAEGKKTWGILGESAARREARLQWEREVVSKLGERYSDPAHAKTLNGDGYSCWWAGRSRRCSFTARPCKA